MLELRPICENCATDLPPASSDARICSYECTFCRDCVEYVLENACPNCGSGCVPRPIRPAQEWRNGVNRAAQSPTSEKKHQPVDLNNQRDLIARLGATPPEQR